MGNSIVVLMTRKWENIKMELRRKFSEILKGNTFVIQYLNGLLNLWLQDGLDAKSINGFKSWLGKLMEESSTKDY